MLLEQTHFPLSGPKKPTTEETVKIMMQYLGQRFVRYSEILIEPTEIISGCKKQPNSSEIWIQDDKDECWVPTAIQVLVKPLESISDEDAIEVAKMYLSEREIHNYYPSKSKLIERGKSISTSIVFNDNYTGHPGPRVIQIIDFLRASGYALPYKNWSVKELEEFGIYKLVDDGTNGK